jgi:hypothetical protein
MHSVFYTAPKSIEDAKKLWRNKLHMVTVLQFLMKEVKEESQPTEAKVDAGPW